MKQYLDLIQRVLDEGKLSKDRTGTGTYRIFGAQLRFNLQEGFPLLTTKKMFYKGIIHELLWMLSGSSFITYLKINNIHIWDEWADRNGYVGPLYGTQWRAWFNSHNNVFIDQLERAINTIKRNPYSRRIIVSAWNVSDLGLMALPPCHLLYQFHPDPESKELSLSMYQRSADCFLGVPFDIGLYALLLSMVAQITGYKPKDLIMNFGDTHIYTNHLDQVKLQLAREPKPLATLKLNPEITDIDDFEFEDITIENYQSYPQIKGEVSV